jgi:hypothetical protein
MYGIVGTVFFAAFFEKGAGFVIIAREYIFQGIIAVSGHCNLAD